MIRALASLAVVVAAAAALAQPQFITIPGVPTDVSDDGTIVIGGNGGSFRWVRSGNGTSYTIVNPNSAGAGAVACTGDGAIMIGSMINANPDLGPLGYQIAGRWTAATGYVEQHDPNVFFGTGTPQTINVARNCTRDGRYIVGFGYQNASRYRAMVHDTQTGMARSPMGISDSGNARILCVSDDATVLGGDDDTTGSAQRPAIWRLVGDSYVGVILEPGTGGAGSSTVSVISADGAKASGQSYFDNNKLVRWQYNAGTGTYAKVILATALTPPGATLTRVVATAMTPDGDTIFGQYNQSRAFMWTAASGMVDLTTMLTAQGITGLPAGSSIGSIAACTPDARTLVGGGGLGATGFVIYRDPVGCIPVTSTPTPSTTEVSMCSRTIIINASGSGTGPFTYQHRKNGVPIVLGPTGNVDVNGLASTYVVDSFAPSQLRVNNAGPLDAGTYDVIITNGCGSVTTEPTVVTARPPDPFDTCATALDASGTGTISLSMCGAYVNERPASCAGTQRADVWIRYTALTAGDYRITCCGFSNFDTILTAYNNCNGPELACSDNFCSSAASIERITLGLNQTIYVRLGVGSAVPSALVNVNFDLLPPPPPNDLCANAQDISDSGSYPWDTTYALTDAAVSCNPNSGKDVWFRFTPARSGTVSFDTCGTLLNTVLTVLDSCGGNELACNDNANVSGCTFQSAITNLPVTARTPVLVRIGANNLNGAGSGNLNTTFTPSGFCPTDLNQDGVTDPDDLSDAISCFFDPGCTFDYDGSGFEDPDDLSTYIAEFFTPGAC